MNAGSKVFGSVSGRAALLDVTGANAAGYGAAGKRRFDERFTYARFRDRFCGEIRRLRS